MEIKWLIVLIVSVLSLLLLIIRTKPDIRWFGYGLLQLVGAAVLLYIINGIGILGEFYIPINAVTVMVIAVLGLPGLGLITVVKLTLM
jgi:inhibitor of the pro-sigma K processing machinery